ncbi:hypothetical protein [Pseudoramibacter alactolyticus]|jgi:hypothetical protein|uniref:hypothetical protein n=1 Tax=Pseudoramibacter alactolyticus TaxID=113287 RepID=UPI00248EF829|nr:hypothetical protein [Pseudoramibacter alactolyticus]
MITVLQACEITSKEDGWQLFSQIVDLGGEFLLIPCDENGGAMDIGSIPTVDKLTGKVGAFFYPKRHKEIESGMDVEVPNQYRPRKK